MKENITVMCTNMGEPRVIFKLTNADDVAWVKTMCEDLKDFGLDIGQVGDLTHTEYFCVLETGNHNMKLNAFFYDDVTLKNRFDLTSSENIMVCSSDMMNCMSKHVLEFVKAVQEYINKMDAKVV